MILMHGTTRDRAARILRTGPDPAYREPGGRAAADGFSACLEAGPFPFGTPADYARGKAAAFPAEGGPVILVLNVPDEIVRKAASAWLPLDQGLVQFDRGAGLEDLLMAWPSVAASAEIRSLP
jgi:hypothetical protein